MKNVISKLMIAGGIVTMLSAPGNDSLNGYCSFNSIVLTAVIGAMIAGVGALVYVGEKNGR